MSENGLAVLSNAERALAEATDPLDFIAVRARAGEQERLARLARKRGEARPLLLKSWELQRRCERSLGEWLAENVDHTGGAGGVSHDGTGVLPDWCPNRNASSRWQQLAQVEDEDFAAYIATLRDNDEDPAVKHLLRTTGQMLVASNENEWHTPAEYVEAARKVLGGIDLDPASTAAANEAVGAKAIYTADDDGLVAPWAGRLWLNPPYGGLAGEFITRLVLEYEAGVVKAAVALVNAHCTDTRWFQPLWNRTLCFTDHRIDFDSAGRDKTSTSTHGSVFAYLGPKDATFAAAFSEFGPIVRRWSA